MSKNTKTFFLLIVVSVTIAAAWMLLRPAPETPFDRDVVGWGCADTAKSGFTER